MEDREKILQKINDLTNEYNENNDYYKISTIQYLGTRENQEDTVSYITQKENVFACLADGIGGLEFGEIASGLSVLTLLKHFITYSSINNQFLVSAMQDADRRVMQFIEDNHLSGSGCTTIGIFINKNDLFFSSVGDSSVFLFRNNQLQLLNRHHNYKLYLDEMLQKERISIKDYRVNLNKKDVVISYIGKGELRLLDFNKQGFKLKEGDILLICSDGLLSALSNELIIEVIKKNKNPTTITTSLMNLVRMKRREKQDNTSIITILKER